MKTSNNVKPINNKSNDWRHLEQFAGEWVMFASDRITVVAHDRILKNAVKKAEEKGCSDPILFKVPSLGFKTFIGAAWM